VLMNALTVISTDLLTPLGAYLRLREGGRASFLLESVERGRLGRHSFVGCGSRLVGFDEAESCGEPVVGYLGYDHAAVLEPTVPLPEAGRDLPEGRFVIAETLVRFDHAAGMAEVLAGDTAEITSLLHGALPEHAAGSGAASGSTRRLPSRHEYERAVVKAKEHIRAGDAFQIVLSQRAERPTSASALDIYRSLRRVNPSPYLFLLELDGLALVGSSPETLVKAEGRAASLNPIAGTTRPGEGDAERLLSSSSRSVSRTSRTSSPRSSASSSPASRTSSSCAPASRPAPSPARRRCGRCRSSRSSSATAAARTRARSSTRCRARRSTRALQFEPLS